MEQVIASLSAYAPLMPEILLVICGLIFLLFGAFGKSNKTILISWLIILAFIGAGALVFYTQGKVEAFNGSFLLDDFARFMKVLTLAAAAFALLLSFSYLRENRMLKYEYAVLILFSVIGMMMMISANDLIALYLGIELQSLALYVVAAFRRDSVKSSEAGLKYFVLGALSSGMLLYGCSLIYGFTGSVSFVKITSIVQEAGPNIGLIFGLVFLLVGLAFKISAVPFHMWTPDVYEGAPTPVTAFFASAPKFAAMALLMRVVLSSFPAITSQWQQIIIFLAIASMALGAFAAIGQRNIKRLIAYSSIGHMGFVLVGLAAGSQEGVKGVLIYLVAYLLMTIGTFACILAMRRSEGMVEDIYELAGLGRNNPLMAFLLAMLMFSLAGIPPLAGFFGKFFVFSAAINAGLYPLAILGVLASVVGAYYYLNIVKIMYFDEPAERFDVMPGALKLVLGISGVGVLFFGLYVRPLIVSSELAAKSLF